MYSLPEQDKAVNKISYKTFHLKAAKEYTNTRCCRQILLTASYANIERVVVCVLENIHDTLAPILRGKRVLACDNLKPTVPESLRLYSGFNIHRLVHENFAA